MYIFSDDLNMVWKFVSQKPTQQTAPIKHDDAKLVSQKDFKFHLEFYTLN